MSRWHGEEGRSSSMNPDKVGKWIIFQEEAMRWTSSSKVKGETGEDAKGSDRAPIPRWVPWGQAQPL